MSHCPAHSWHPATEITSGQNTEISSTRPQVLKHYSSVGHGQSLSTETYPKVEIHRPLQTFLLRSDTTAILLSFRFTEVSPMFTKSRLPTVIIVSYMSIAPFYSLQSVFPFVTAFLHYTYLKGWH